MRIVKWILAAVFFTASFDTILLINVGGVVRFSQLLLALICVAAFAKVIQDGRILWPRGSTPLMLWLLTQFLFLPLSGVIAIGVQFFALLSFTIVAYFAVIQLYGKSLSLEPMMRLYLLSYVFVGFFGLLQFTLPVLGLPSPLVTQWLIHGRFPRISGFNYEPSFYVTYLMMGWIMLVELRHSKARIVSGRLWKWTTIAITASLILSSSKTAWAFMLLELFARLGPAAWRGIRSSVRQILQGRLLISLPRGYVWLNVVLLLAVVIAGVYFLPKVINPATLLNGTGLANTPAHSVNERNDAATSTWAAFLDEPFIGRSLGGVPIYKAMRNGIEIHSMAEVRAFWGFPVILDVLVASGVIGIIPFLIFVYANTIGALRTATRYWPSERAKWLRALARAMIFECFLLMVDQNLLRVYLWVHASMVALIAYNLEFGDVVESIVVAAGSPSPQLETMPST